MMSFLDYDLELAPEWAGIIKSELPLWERYYLPVDVKDMTVLDLGAGCGETAAFYFSHGAMRVIAIEPNELAFALLKRNAAVNGWDLVPHHSHFRLEHLEEAHDLMKMDIEGGETLLFGWKGLLSKPCVIEAHSDRIASRLIRQFSLKRVARLTAQGHPKLSLLHLEDSALPEYRTTVKEYLSIAKVALKEHIK